MDIITFLFRSLSKQKTSKTKTHSFTSKPNQKDKSPFHALYMWQKSQSQNYVVLFFRKYEYCNQFHCGVKWINLNNKHETDDTHTKI